MATGWVCWGEFSTSSHTLCITAVLFHIVLYTEIYEQTYATAAACCWMFSPPSSRGQCKRTPYEQRSFQRRSFRTKILLHNLSLFKNHSTLATIMLIGCASSSPSSSYYLTQKRTENSFFKTKQLSIGYYSSSRVQLLHFGATWKVVCGHLSIKWEVQKIKWHTYTWISMLNLCYPKNKVPKTSRLRTHLKRPTCRFVHRN